MAHTVITFYSWCLHGILDVIMDTEHYLHSSDNCILIIANHCPIARVFVLFVACSLWSIPIFHQFQTNLIAIWKLLRFKKLGTHLWTMIPRLLNQNNPRMKPHKPIAILHNLAVLCGQLKRWPVKMWNHTY